MSTLEMNEVTSRNYHHSDTELCNHFDPHDGPYTKQGYKYIVLCAECGAIRKMYGTPSITNMYICHVCGNSELEEHVGMWIKPQHTYSLFFRIVNRVLPLPIGGKQIFPGYWLIKRNKLFSSVLDSGKFKK